MKKIVYITKDKVWFDGVSVDWSGNNLIDVFKSNKDKFGSSDTRIILGNDVSFLASFPENKTDSLTRENVMEETKNHVPLDVHDDCFDWKSVQVDKEKWIQTVTVDKDFLGYVSRAVKDSGLKVNLMIPVGVLIAQRSLWKEEVLLIKWAGLEALTVLAKRGLVDSVYTNIADEVVLGYAKNKWNLEADPEILVLNNENFDINKEAFGEKNKGDDAEVLNILVFKNPEPVSEVPLEVSSEKVDNLTEQKEPVMTEVESREDAPKNNKKRIWGVLALVLVITLGVGGWLLLSGGDSRDEAPATPISTPAPVPTATPAAVIDLSKYSVQVLNGSGVTGLASSIRDIMLAEGFETVDVGNTDETTKSTIQIKDGTPKEVYEKITTKLSEYSIVDGDKLAVGDEYDVIVIIGSKE